MDPDLERLLSIPGHDDLTTDQASYVLGLCPQTIGRAVKRGSLGGKYIEGRGQGSHTRLRIPRAAVIKRIVRAHTDKTLILGDIAAHCPQYLQTAQAPAEATAADLPANVIPMTGPQRKRKPRPLADPCPGHPELFPISPAHTA